MQYFHPHTLSTGEVTPTTAPRQELPAPMLEPPHGEVARPDSLERSTSDPATKDDGLVL